MRYWLGRLMCKLGWHDWYEGMTKAYCCRSGCNAHYSLWIDDSYEDYDG